MPMPMPTARGVERAAADETLADVVDKLVALQLDLRQLSHAGRDALEQDARRMVADACETLHSVSVELVAMLRPMPGRQGDAVD